MTKKIGLHQHCTSKKCPYTMSHTARWCGYEQKRRCGCAFCYPQGGVMAEKRRPWCYTCKNKGGLLVEVSSDGPDYDVCPTCETWPRKRVNGQWVWNDPEGVWWER